MPATEISLATVCDGSRPPSPSSRDNSHISNQGFEFSTARPKFNSRITSDRLHDDFVLRPLPFPMIGNIRKGRKSVFTEVGLDDDVVSDDGFAENSMQHDAATRTASNEKDNEDIPCSDADPENENGDNHSQKSEKSEQQQRTPRQQSRHESYMPSSPATTGASTAGGKAPWYSKLSPRRPKIRTSVSSPSPAISGMHRVTMLALIVALVFPGFGFRNEGGKQDHVADAGVIRVREQSSTDVCTRWAHQVAQLNGTLYIYGGQAKTTGDQEFNTWNNYFLTLDLQESWETHEPSLTGLQVPDGPPAVSLGYLWQDYNSLYLYGGQFADNDGGPQEYATPAEMALWRYSIADESWTSFANPETSAGNYSTDGGIPVQRAAEGAGISVPELGLSWYFGGHMDVATTPGWSIHVPRLYLSSLLEWTHPGYGNNGVDSLRDAGASEGGAYRNITEGGTQQDSEEFPERADAVLIFVPGWGPRGVLIGLGGGADEDLTENMETLDVFDIEASEWYHQETTGDKPPNRVNPCAVIASAPDASSFQIYLFGGQDLPFGNQTQYNDMYILTIPAFHWIRVEDGDDSNVPYPRAGHTCTMRDGQIILVGGYVGEDIACDSPGIYVFNATSLQWSDRFIAGDHEPDHSPDNSVLAGSWGYRVPRPVHEVIGGGADGGATVTTPGSGPATGGPFATGTPPVFTITEGGGTATVTQPAPGVTGGGGGVGSGPDEDDPSDSGSSSGSDPSPGLIAAGVIAGLLGILAAYLAFCVYLYRRQVAAYKRHLAIANRYSGASHHSFGAVGFLGLLGRKRTRNSEKAHRRGESLESNESFGWVGAGSTEPKWTMDGPSPSSGSGTVAGSGSGLVAAQQMRQSEDVRSGYTRTERGGDTDRGSVSSTEQLLDGQEPSFFSVVMGPRRALRVVNGMGEGTGEQQGLHQGHQH